MKQPTREQKFRVLLFNAMIRPRAALVLAVTIVVALNVGYWFFAVGAVFYALLVYTSLQDVQESKKVLDEVLYPEHKRKIELNKLTGAYRTAMQRALDTRRKIETAVAETGDAAIRKALADSTGDLDDLTGTIYDIGLKAQSLQASLASSNVRPEALAEEIKRLERIVDSTHDEFARGQYEATLQGKRQQLANYTDANDALNRWHAQLDNALSTLDTILSQVLRIRSAEVLSLSTATDQVSQSLKEEVEALKATSDALDAVYGLSK
jgi:hypothetical protein